ncbi:MAG: TonB-dependent receptor [Marinobacterium sp.]|nr:TonB-dependent receptor [Marinobacterium sp.]
MRPEKWLPVFTALAVTPATVFADQSSRSLDDVVVTASLTERSAALSPAFTTVISADDIAKSPANSLPEILRQTAGVNSKMDNTGRDEIQIRGMDGNYTLLLVNGKRVTSRGALWRGGDFDYNTIPLASIERVEIVRGPAAAIYGSDAIGGVVNIITKKAEQGKWSGQVTAEARKIQPGEQGDQYRLNGFASGALNDSVSMALSAEWYDREDWFRHSASDPQEVAVLEEKHNGSLATTTTFELDGDNSLDLDLSYSRDKRPYGLWNYVHYPQWDYENYSYHKQDVERSSYGLTHNGNWDWGNSVVFLKQERTDIDDYNSDYDAPKQRNLKEINTYFKAYGTTALSNHTLTAGIDLRRQKIEDPVTYLETGEVTTDTRALFAQDEIALTESLFLTLGGRLDDHEVFGGEFSPKAYLAWSASDALTVKGGVSKAFKAPDAYQLSREYRIISCGGNCFLSGNPNLTPETSIAYELGFELRQNSWDFEAVAFYNDVEDMILAVYDPDGPSREWQNIAAAETWGIELSGSTDLSDSLSLSGNFTWLDTEYAREAGTNVGLDYRPEIMANLTLDWQATDRTLAFIKLNHIGEQLNGSNELPDYTLVGLGVNVEVTPELMLRTGIQNLTDVDLEEEDSNFQHSELGRNYYLSATWNF